MCEHTVSNVEYGAEEKGMDEERQYQPADTCILHLERLVLPVRSIQHHAKKDECQVCRLGEDLLTVYTLACTRNDENGEMKDKRK
jgi:hypothetical protein